MNYVTSSTPIWPGDRVESKVLRSIEGDVMDTYRDGRTLEYEALVKWDNEHIDAPTWTPVDQLTILEG
jgi:hypothetical protein